MIWILLAMFAILALAALVFVYVAYPYRGRDVPKAAWLGDTLVRGVERLPTLDNTEDSDEHRTVDNQPLSSGVRESP